MISQKAIAYIKRKYKETKAAIPVAIDLETVGLSPWGVDVFIVSISITYRRGKSEVIRFKSKKADNQPAVWLNPDESDYHKYRYKSKNKNLRKQIIWLNNKSCCSSAGGQL